MRLEKDSLGELEVPDEAYYGIQTVRTSNNYRVSNHTYNEYPEVIAAVAEIKKACAITNAQIGALNEEKARAICKACDEVISGKFAGHFPVNVWRSQGTGVNMNVNEVLANRANEILTGKVSYEVIHPNTHVNMCQSSNDVFPTAEAIVIFRLIEPVLKEAREIESTLLIKANEFKEVVRLGRTGLQDAVPMTWGQVFAGWLRSVSRVRKELENLRPIFQFGVMGGTAVGTGMGVLPGYPELIYPNLSKVIGFEMKQRMYEDEVVKNSGIFDGMRNTDHHSILMEVIKELVAAITRIANDLILYSSGPRAGIKEVVLSYIAEGTTGYESENTAYLCELMTDVLGEMVIAEEMAFYSSNEGQLDHGSINSGGFITVVNALKLAASSLRLFNEECLKEVQINEEVVRGYAELSTSLSTMVSSLFGYPTGVKVAKKAIETNRSCKEVAKQEKILSSEVCEEIFDVLALTDRDKTVELFRKYKSIRKID
ncbi:lyase family protein [Turicimonas muris]|uniref:lyase family protein n=2 Tax=Turicimonas muris TaxID=1796652 RepID=UPI0023F0D1D9|nr:lyase family protein [Turicimonas muris]